MAEIKKRDGDNQKGEKQFTKRIKISFFSNENASGFEFYVVKQKLNHGGDCIQVYFNAQQQSQQAVTKVVNAHVFISWHSCTSCSFWALRTESRNTPDTTRHFAFAKILFCYLKKEKVSQEVKVLRSLMPGIHVCLQIEQ